MTTIAYDGISVAADSLAVDNWGLIEPNAQKVWVLDNAILAGAGSHGHVVEWAQSWDFGSDLQDILDAGYAKYDPTNRDPNLLVVCRMTGDAWRVSSGVFIKITRPYMAIGSGRDFALAAMHYGKTAKEAVELACYFDNNSRGPINVYPLK